MKNRNRSNNRSAMLCTAVSLILVFLAGCSGNTSTTPDAQSSASTAPQASSSASNGEAIELSYYFPIQASGPLAVAMEKIVNDYNESQSDIHVNFTFTGDYAATMEKTLTAVNGGNAPHVVLASDSHKLLEMGALVNINDMIAKEPSSFKDDYIPNFFPAFVDPTNNSFQHSMPYQISSSIMLYNKEVLADAGLDPESPPTTWSELETVTQAIKAHDSKLIPFEFMDDGWMGQALVRSNGGYINKDLDNMNLDSPEHIEQVEFFKGLQDDGLVKMNKSYGGVAENFIAGTSAVILNTSGSLGNIVNTADFNFGVAPVPAKDGKESVNVMGGGGLIILNKHPQEEINASWEFVKYLTGPEAAAEWMAVSGYFAVNKLAYEEPVLKTLFEEKPQYEQLSKLAPTLEKVYRVRKNSSEMNTLINNVFDEIYLNNADIAAALQQAQKDAQALLAD
ncbi:ABC transporter substrate-binding protein [Paenibacillus chungangensis]|uniref:ABC transporter substrate-binding protein n=1 Tax=Paenibacillus chungangensis TaxID=696535 RepID=A0ABW3HSL9_9BACL